MLLTGFGSLTSGKRPADDLQYIWSRVISSKSCSQSMEGKHEITNDMICTKSLPKQVDSCIGDIGSPLVVFENAASHRVRSYRMRRFCTRNYSCDQAQILFLASTMLALILRCQEEEALIAISKHFYKVLRCDCRQKKMHYKDNFHLRKVYNASLDPKIRQVLPCVRIS